jgi:signal transduction histidine kinase
MEESANGQTILALYPNDNGNKIPFYSRIGTKLAVGFLAVAVITGTVGYLSFDNSQTVGEKFHLLITQSLPTIDSLKELKAAALNIEVSTKEYLFTPDVNDDVVLQELNEQKDKFNENLNIYEGLVDKYFPAETDLKESIHSSAVVFLQTSDKLVELRNNATVGQGFQTTEDELFQEIDSAISNEVEEIQSRSEIVDAAINNSSLITLSSIIISVVVAVVFGLIFSRYISIPISNLKQASIQIGKGDYVTACKFLSKTHRADEIGRLSSEIEKMRQSIESMKTNLDKLVEQRTKEIETKNAQLIEREKDLERVNKELVNTELAKEEFVSMVSHELKTPLTPLKMYVEMFLKKNRMGVLNEKQLKAMRMIQKSASKLELLINDIFDVYKLDISRLRLNKEPIKVARLIQQNISQLAPLTEDKKIGIRPEIISPSGNVSVLCDPQRIEQVIANLVKNSVDFVPDKGGRITIRAETNETHRNVTFSIQDNGIGIPLEKMDNLFKTFYQVDTSLTRKHGGTGLGLVICKGIIESHGGKIWIDKNYTQGTSISFTLPIANENARSQNDTSSV